MTWILASACAALLVACLHWAREAIRVRRFVEDDLGWHECNGGWHKNYNGEPCPKDYRKVRPLDFSDWKKCVGVASARCKGCGRHTQCRFGWCWSCDGDMRVVDGVLWELCRHIRYVALVASLSSDDALGGTPDLFEPPVECAPWELTACHGEDNWDVYWRVLKEEIRDAREIADRYCPESALKREGANP